MYLKDFDCGKAIRTLEEFLRDAGGIQGITSSFPRS